MFPKIGRIPWAGVLVRGREVGAQLIGASLPWMIFVRGAGLRIGGARTALQIGQCNRDRRSRVPVVAELDREAKVAEVFDPFPVRFDPALFRRCSRDSESNAKGADDHQRGGGPKND